MSYKILYSILFLLLASATYVWATTNPNDRVIISNEEDLWIQRNFTVNGLTNNQIFQINMTAEGLNITDWKCFNPELIYDSNSLNVITFNRAYRKVDSPKIYFIELSNSAVSTRNMTLGILCTGF